MRQATAVGLIGGAVLCGLMATAGVAAPARPGEETITVKAPTRLDWIFALANQSLPEAPAEWLKDYDSTKTTYTVVAPARRSSSLPALIFITPGASFSWGAMSDVCRPAGVLLVGITAAPNDVPMPRRIRIVLDVLDDVRQRYPIDPDRTYIGGFSGGGRVASAVAFALPELFGGILSVGAGAELRDETWLRHRAVDRLSVAMLSGQGDFNLGEVSRWRGPFLTEVGVRTKVWPTATRGHGMPDATNLGAAIKWLDDGAKDRAQLAKTWPAMRIDAQSAPSRAEWSQALLAEARLRIAKPATLYSGLMQLQGIRVRWADLPAATAATKILVEYDARDARPWEADDLAEQRLYLIAGARALDAYASGDLPQQYLKQRGGMARAALEMWQQVLADQPDSAAGKEAQKRIPELEKIATEK